MIVNLSPAQVYLICYMLDYPASSGRYSIGASFASALEDTYHDLLRALADLPLDVAAEAQSAVDALIAFEGGIL